MGLFPLSFLGSLSDESTDGIQKSNSAELSAYCRRLKICGVKPESR